jgi:hypothetical protein
MHNITRLLLLKERCAATFGMLGFQQQNLWNNCSAYQIHCKNGM